MRLDKFLAEKGLGTRTEIKALLNKGLITVAGEVVKLAKYQLTDLELAKVAYQGELLTAHTSRVFAFYKPIGVLSASNDAKMPCALDYLPKNLQTRKYSCVGRLDKYSEGLLLISNDGELIHRLTQPKWQIKKLYYIEFTPDLAPLEADIIAAQFLNGLKIADLNCKPAIFTALSPNSAKVTVSEGKFHQVRRMLAHFKHEVTKLIRLQEGAICLDNLQPGELRELTEIEYLDLYNELGLKRS